MELDNSQATEISGKQENGSKDKVILFRDNLKTDQKSSNGAFCVLSFLLNCIYMY